MQLQSPNPTRLPSPPFAAAVLNGRAFDASRDGPSSVLAADAPDRQADAAWNATRAVNPAVCGWRACPIEPHPKRTAEAAVRPAGATRARRTMPRA